IPPLSAMKRLGDESSLNGLPDKRTKNKNCISIASRSKKSEDEGTELSRDLDFENELSLPSKYSPEMDIECRFEHADKNNMSMSEQNPEKFYKDDMHPLTQTFWKHLDLSDRLKAVKSILGDIDFTKNLMNN